MADSELEVLIRGRDELSGVIKGLTGKLKELQRTVNGLGSGGGLEEVADDADEAADSAGELADNLDDARKAADKLGDAGAEELADDLGEADENADDLAEGMDGVASAVGAVVIAAAALLATFTAAARAGQEFQLQIAEVATLTSEGGDAIGRLSDSVLELSNAYGVARGEVSAGLYQAISAGAEDGAEAISLMEVALKTSIAGVTDVRTAIDGLTTIINAWGLETEDAGRVADVMFTTVKNGKTTIDELSRSFFQVAPLASSLGVSLEETSGAITTLTLQGTPTRVAMTQIRASMQGLLRPTDELSALFQQATGHSAQWVIENEGLASALDIVRTSTNGNIGEMLKLVGSIEGVNAILGLTGQNAQEFSDQIGNATNAAGSLNEAFQTIDETNAQSLTKALNNITNDFVELGLIVLPLAKDIAESIAEVTHALVEFAQENPGLTKTVADIAIGFSGVTIVLVSLGAAVLTVAGTFKLLAKSFGLLTGAKGAATVTTGVNALGVAVTTATPATNVFTGAVGRMGLAFKTLGKVLLGPLGLILAAVAAWAIYTNRIRLATAEQEKLNEMSERGLQASRDLNQLKPKNLGSLSIIELNKELKALENIRKRLKEVGEAAIESGDTAEFEAMAAMLDVVNKRLVKTEAALVRLKKASVVGVDPATISIQTMGEAAVETASMLTSLNELQFDDLVDNLTRVSKSRIAALTANGDTAGIRQEQEALSTAIIAAAERRRDQELVIAAQTANAQADFIRQTATLTEEQAEEALEITRELAARKIEAEGQFAATIEGQLEQATAAYRKYGSNVSKLEAGIETAQRRSEGVINGIIEEGLTSYEIYTRRRKQLDELASKSTRAFLTGDFAEAIRLGEEQQKIAASLTSVINKADGSKRVNEEKARKIALESAYDAEQNILQAKRAQSAETAKLQQAEGERIQSLQQLLETSQASIEKFTSDAIEFEVSASKASLASAKNLIISTLGDLHAEISVIISEDTGFGAFKKEVDTFSTNPKTLTFDSSSEDIAELFGGIEDFVAKDYTINFNLKTTGNLPTGGQLQQFASGGYVSGPGTGISDSILAMLSNGEYVIRAAAVKRYGADFFRMLNTMQLPRGRMPGYANGGPVVGAKGGGEGSLSQSQRDMVDIHLTLGGETTQVMGDRKEARKLIRTLKTLRN